MGDGFHPGPDSLDELEQIVTARRVSCEAAGRDVSEVEISAAYPGRFLDDPVNAIEAMAALRIDRLMVPVYPIAKARIDEGMRVVAEIIETAGAAPGG